MYLSLIESRLTHRDVMRAFPQGEGSSVRAGWKILYRVDGDNTLVQSAIEPFWDNLLGAGYRVKDLEFPVIESGTQMTFRLAFNPVKRIKQSDKKNGALAVVNPTLWLKSREEFIGATFDVSSIRREHESERSGSHKVTIHRAVADGILTVVDGERLRNAVVSGVGRARAYGCGLLSVA